MELAERDWQVSDELLIVAREQFCANALSQVRAEVEDATKAQHTKYQRIGELIRLWDEKAAGLFKETGRSTVPRLKQIAVLYSMKLLDDELSRFSPEAMAAVSAFKAASKA